MGRGKMLVVERGLRGTRRNRRWLALIKFLDDQGVANGDQEKIELLSWKIINLMENTP